MPDIMKVSLLNARTMMTLPVTHSGTQHISRIVKVTEFETEPGTFWYLPSEQENISIGKDWQGAWTQSIPKAFQQAFDRAAYGLRVQNRRTWR